MAEVDARPAETVDIIRYTAVPNDEVGFRIDPAGEWIRFEDVWSELIDLRKRVRAFVDTYREGLASAGSSAAVNPRRSASLETPSLTGDSAALSSNEQVSAVEAFKVLVEEIDATGVYLDRPADAVKFIAQCVSSALTKLIQRETPEFKPSADWKRANERTKNHQYGCDCNDCKLLRSESPTATQFIECDTCRAKPGSPTLCAGCLHNRRIIEALTGRMTQARHPVETNGELERLQKIEANAVAFDKAVAEFGVNPDYISEVFQALSDSLPDESTEEWQRAKRRGALLNRLLDQRNAAWALLARCHADFPDPDTISDPEKEWRVRRLRDDLAPFAGSPSKTEARRTCAVCAPDGLLATEIDACTRGAECPHAAPKCLIADCPEPAADGGAMCTEHSKRIEP